MFKLINNTEEQPTAKNVDSRKGIIHELIKFYTLKNIGKTAFASTACFLKHLCAHAFKAMIVKKPS